MVRREHERVEFGLPGGEFVCQALVFREAANESDNIRQVGTHRRTQREGNSIRLSGSSTIVLNSGSQRAPSAPSTQRWSTLRVQVITVAMANASFFTTGRFAPVATARIADCGGLMMAENSLTPNMPM